MMNVSEQNLESGDLGQRFRDREQEEKSLAEIIKVAQENLEGMQARISSLSVDLQDLLETYGTKDKEALALWHNTESQLNESRQDLVRCLKARKKPYFGWVDFRDVKLSKEEAYYVGRVGIARNGSEPIVIDWRAPVASVYYENNIGRCRYMVKKGGTYEIDLKRKRTYEIADDKLIDFFDSDVVATDELLTKYLAKSKKAVLGEIIATIQKEQNEIIRKSPKTNLIVQGVAGSGKTTVAMHRISYILYNYEEFRPQDFYIIGSNRILLNYITGVLPDLDVYGVSQMTMEQLFTRLMYEDWEPQICHIRPLDRKDPLACVKGSYAWFHDLERYCIEYENNFIPKNEICLQKNNALLMGPDTICAYLENNPQVSMQSKINMLNEILQSRLENELAGKYVSFSPIEVKELKKKYQYYFGKDVWKGSIFQVYEGFLQSQSEKGMHMSVPENSFDVYDLAALAYLYKRIKETDGIREASHIIIDEAQDFGMMAYGALKYCLRDCTYTIMGDVSQNIYYGYGLNDWEDLRKLILTGTFDSFGLLKKSYRNTVEISNFATEILRHGEFSVYPVEPIVRHGNAVRVIACEGKEDMLEKSAEQIHEWQKDGHETIAVICRDGAEASLVSEKLGQKVTVEDSNLETAEFGNGVFVLPVEYTKGLEFDAVLIYDPSVSSYPAEDQYVKLLYVAATRALHELTVVHAGDLTELIARPVSQEKRMRSLEMKIVPKTKRYEKKEYTAEELEEQMAREGHREMRQRDYLGPKKIVVPRRTEPATNSAVKNKNIVMPASSNAAPQLNESPYLFASVPDSSLLRPMGHGRIDTSIRWAKKTKRQIDLASSYGILRITPVHDAVIRVQFRKGQGAEFAPGYWNYVPGNMQEDTPEILLNKMGNNKAGARDNMADANPAGAGDNIVGSSGINVSGNVSGNAPGGIPSNILSKFPAWKAKEGKLYYEIHLEQVTVLIEKKSGALQFFNKNGVLLLAEKSTLPRQVEMAGSESKTWNYFEWKKSEKLYAKGLANDNLEPVNQKARYISFGGKKLRMPLLLSGNGYGIGIAARAEVMCCAIPMYGPYIYAGQMEQIDYYFIYGGKNERTVELYKRLVENCTHE